MSVCHRNSSAEIDRMLGCVVAQLETCIHCRDITASNKMKYFFNVVRLN